MRKTILVLLLVFAAPATDWTGAVARKVTVLGDISTARHVAVIVPGSDVDVARFDRTVGRMARELYDHTARDDLAVVAWLGYRTPQGLGVDAATGRLAAAGARELVDFVHALPSQAHVHVFGHSYGSVVVGLAARDLAVDDIVFTGSPGVRASSVAELGTTARVWAARASGDWTRWVPKVRLFDLGHGTDPTARSFGARSFAAEGSHDSYYEPGSASLHALSLIAVGEQP
ncbi:hypothetical protein FKR81_04785 [Lentzea tibetensis]|uniref:DUF1023 domain-containing protein n=1 Tax=Lentzea tibetensis TaxID=2591470 RepID=A0A563EZZ5_9PSEU|nr:alpha/beta hydrolase [Lentzea tibetensis]TWP53290.1 hypothetical protein FKR81_04785 [Lentzea tibetensis]